MESKELTANIFPYELNLTSTTPRVFPLNL